MPACGLQYSSRPDDGRHLRPRVILPLDWPNWPAATLAAALAHERAHARRRDGLTLFVAAANQCVFWFHPLSWWLTRKISTVAEDVCDDAGVRAAGSGRAYAQILLSIAEATRLRGGRVAWTAVGISGTGRIDRRIDRILQSSFTPSSYARSAAVIAVCSAGLLIVASCRQPAVKPIELKEDPVVAQRLANQKALTAFHDAAGKMTRDQIAVLEQAVKAREDDLEAPRGVLPRQARKGGDQSKAVADTQRHLHWMIEHHPEDDIAIRYATPWLGDPAGDVEARRLWLAQASKPTATSAVLSNAAYFFESADPATAERFLLRAKEIDPDGPTPRVDASNVYHLPWNRRLGTLYARLSRHEGGI